MRVVRYYGARDLRVEEVDPPQPGSRDVVLEVVYCGICGTDLAEYASGPHLVPRTSHPLTHRNLPLTLGHEFFGVVAAVGEDVEDLSAGMRVVPEVALACGTCRYCLRGRPALCDQAGALGLQADGGLSEQVLLEASTCRMLPQDITDIRAALLEPTEVVVRALRAGQFLAGEHVLVLGAGPIGLLAIVMVNLLGGHCTVIEQRGSRRELALHLGAVAAVPPEDLPPFSISDAPDLALDCAGSSSSTERCVQSVAKGARIVVIGTVLNPALITMGIVVERELSIIGTVQHSLEPDLDTAIQLMAQAPTEVETIVTSVVSLSEVPATFERLIEDPGNEVKVLVTPGLVPM